MTTLIQMGSFSLRPISVSTGSLVKLYLPGVQMYQYCHSDPEGHNKKLHLLSQRESLTTLVDMHIESACQQNLALHPCMI